MGLYSVNRTSLMNESFNYGAEDLNSGSLMETCIEIHENDNKMFESLIRCDFISVNESIDIKGQANKIWEKIKALIEKVKTAIKKAFATITSKIKNLVANDTKLYVKYADTLTMSNLAGFEGIENFGFEALDNEQASAFADMVDEVQGISLDMTREQIDAKAKKVKEVADSFKKEGSMDIEKKEKWMPSADELEEIKEMVKNGGKLLQLVKHMYDDASKNIEILKGRAKTIIGKKNDYTEEEIYVAKSVYDICSSTLKGITRYLNMSFNVSTIQLAAARKAFIVCGKYAKNKAEGKDTSTNEAVDYILGEMSDMYVFESLAFN